MGDIGLGSIPIEYIHIGMSISYSQTITDSDIKGFAGLTGDYNPVHVDEMYAADSRFGRRIAHGLLTAGFFSALFGTRLPGPGCVYVSQNLNFKRPVYIGDTVVATVKVTSVDVSSKRVLFETTCTVKNKTVTDGVAEIFIPGNKAKSK
ncbi:MaoC family dehydratase [Colwellia sp. MB3u-70]|uniref:MaoC family dehydratase n=1 Tax=unclassified Colwellia TaxID=196834 RepID=UPI0015F5B17F|nr:MULTISPECIES: MaoC family dehydratase [unclassified Colwellia]MBA6291518.1 MaoC family dehydratase [Colwellia sp. MB3u-8]MBA6308968.1 MaoC family dehydratase [Colwellia sp. MB3u-70]